MKKSKFLFAIFTAVSAFNANAYQTEVGTMYEFTDMDGEKLIALELMANIILIQLKPKIIL